jgi:hypothetical protein
MKRFIDFLEEEFGDLIREKYGKKLTEVTSNLYKKKIERDGEPIETVIGGNTSIKVFLKEGTEQAYYYAGGGDRIELFKAEGNKILDYFKEYQENRRGGGLPFIEDEDPLMIWPKTEWLQPSIDKFIKRHEKHSISLDYTPTSVGGVYQVNCDDCKKMIDITDYDSW